MTTISAPWARCAATRTTRSSSNLFAQADWRFAERLSATLGLRRSLVRFDSHDHFITAANPDDSGSVSYANTSPVADWPSASRPS